MWRLFLYLCEMKIDELIKRLNSIDANDILDEAIIFNEQGITTLNREQLDIGLLADGTALPNYSQTSVEVFGKPAGRIRLFDTGAFWSGFYIDLGLKAFDIKSTDEKSEMLTDRYSIDVFGLTKKQTTEAANIIKPQFTELLKKSLNL